MSRYVHCWRFGYFLIIVRQQLNVKYNGLGPLANRWMQSYNPGGSEAGVKVYRAMLDSLRAEEVVWDPYHMFRGNSERSEVGFYEGCITARDIVEPYHPDRVLRQLGHIQTIPRAPLRSMTARREK